MTSATVKALSSKLCIIEFAYSASAKNAVKELAGATFDGEQWTVPVMHLPTLKNIFTKLTVDPVVVEAYHELLRRMVNDLQGHEHKKDAKALLSKHAVGIVAMQAKYAQMVLQLR